MKKKILFLDLTSLVGGSYESLKGVVGGVDPIRYECHLVSYQDLGDEAARNLFATVTVLPGGSAWYARWRKGLRTRLRPFSSSLGWPHAILERGAVLAFRRVLDTVEPDLIYGNVDPASEAIFFREAVRQKIPVISHMRTSAPPRTGAGLTRFLNSYVTQFISNSAYTKKMWVNWGLRVERHEIIWNGVSWTDASQKSDERSSSIDSRFRFVCCGRLVALKRWDIVLEALAILFERDSIPAFDCTFLGGGPEMSNLKDLAVTLGLDKVVHFPGHQSDAMRMLPGFDCLLHATTQETFGRVIIEAMHTGVVVVACGAGGVVEIIEDGRTGYLAQGETAEDFVQAITRCLEEKAKWPDLREAARVKASQDFSLENQNQRINDQIARVCEPHQSVEPGISI